MCPTDLAPDVNAVGELFMLRGDVVAITGGATGLGRVFAEALSKAGARIVLIGRSEEKLARTTRELVGRGGSVTYRVADVTSPDAIDGAFGAVVASLGRLDVVVGSAGVPGDRGFAAGGPSLDRASSVDWDIVLRTNLSGAFNTLRAASPRMTSGGRIILVSSIAGLRPSPRVGYGYVASKSALQGLCRQVALELAPRGIRVNVVAPGPFDTDFGGAPTTSSSIDWPAIVPLGRVASPHELEGLALLLASGASSYVTGSIITIDGGASMGSF